MSRDSLQFDVLRNALMHTMRQRWFDMLHRGLMFCIVVSGTAGVAVVAQKAGGEAVLAALSAVLASLDLVLDLRGKARLHDDLRRRYYHLLAKIEGQPAATAATLDTWRSEMVLLTAEEPDLFQVVDCLAYNAALYSLGRNPEKALVIAPWRRLLAHVLASQGYNPPTRDELPLKPTK